MNVLTLSGVQFGNYPPLSTPGVMLIIMEAAWFKSKNPIFPKWRGSAGSSGARRKLIR
jgi:hypothetical protein